MNPHPIDAAAALKAEAHDRRNGPCGVCARLEIGNVGGMDNAPSKPELSARPAATPSRLPAGFAARTHHPRDVSLSTALAAEQIAEVAGASFRGEVRG